MKKLHRQHNQASALLMALWAIAFLSLLLVGVTTIVQNNQQESASLVENLQARQIAENGLALALHPDVGIYDPVLKGKSEIGGNYEVKILSEAARLNINQLLSNSSGCEALTRLFTRWGLKNSEISIVMDSLQDWVDGDSIPRLNGAESDYYRDKTAESGGQFPPNRPFQNVREMGFVRGMDIVAAHKPDWENYFTVWSEGPLDLNDAPAETIAAVCQIGLPQAQAVIDAREHMRNNPDPQAQRWTDLSQPLTILGVPPAQWQNLGQLLTVSSNVWRAESSASLGTRAYTVGVVFQRGVPKSSVLYRYER